MFDYLVGLGEVLDGLVEFEEPFANVEEHEGVLYLESHYHDVHEVQGTVIDRTLVTEALDVLVH